MSSPSGSSGQPRFEDPNDPYRFGRPETPLPPLATPVSQGPNVWAPQQQNPQGFQGPPPGYGYPAYGSAWPQQQTHRGSGRAVAALVLGILSILFFFLTIFDLVLIIPAIVFASLALNDAKRGAPGRGMAVAGLTCAVIGAVAAVSFTVWAVPKVAKCANEYPTNSAGYKTCINNIIK